MLDRKGRVKIADFGLAKLLGRTPTDPTLTGTHQVMGTPHYMAPEQVERPLTVDTRGRCLRPGRGVLRCGGPAAHWAVRAVAEVRGRDAVDSAARAGARSGCGLRRRGVKTALFDVVPPPANALLFFPIRAVGPAGMPFESRVSAAGGGGDGHRPR